MSHFIKIDPSRRNLVNEIFYNFTCYDALEFEISCIRKVRDTLKELFLLDIRHSRFTETEVTQRMNRFLRLMLITKYCQFAETLGATAIAFLDTKIKGSNMVHSKFDEQKIVLDTLSHYQVGDVTNFYRTINKRQTSYIANLMGYPPPSLQDREEREVLEKSCLKIRDLLHSIGYYFLFFFDLYNANKHGYRTIPTTINDYDEGIIIVKDCGEPALLRLELNDIDKMFGLSSHCRSLLQNLVENHRLAMRVSYENEKNLNLKIYRNKDDTTKPFDMNLLYPSREDLIREIKEAEKNVLKRIQNVDSYRDSYILLDLDQVEIIFSDRELQKVLEFYHNLDNDEPDKEHRRTITRLTEKYLAELK